MEPGRVTAIRRRQRMLRGLGVPQPLSVPNDTMTGT
jgi:hypothetical protein